MRKITPEDEEFNRRLGNLIAVYCVRNGMSFTAVAKGIGMSFRGFANVRNGANISSMMLRRLVVFLGITPKDLSLLFYR